MPSATTHIVFVAHMGPHLSVVAAVGVVLVGGLLWGARETAGTRPRRALLGLALAGLGFQVVHAVEHVLQLGYWLWHPTEGPWLTPWASAGQDVLARVAGGSASAGNELLHLVGNLIFLAALGALRWWASATRPNSLRRALGTQGIHVGEHVLLATTTLTLGRAVGVTTGFGLLAPGTTLATATRVWSHFGLNLVATWFALSAVRQVTTRVRASEDGRSGSYPVRHGAVRPHAPLGQRTGEVGRVAGELDGRGASDASCPGSISRSSSARS